MGFKPILETRVFFAVFYAFYAVNEAKTSNQFPVMKTSTEIFQIFAVTRIIEESPSKTVTLSMLVLEQMVKRNKMHKHYFSASVNSNRIREKFTTLIKNWKSDVEYATYVQKFLCLILILMCS